MTERLIVLALAAASAVWAMRNWRDAVKAVLVLLVFEGAIRKWLFPGSQQLVYFAKDVLLLGAYAGFARAGSAVWDAVPKLPLVGPVLGTAAVWGALQIFNPNLPNLLVGILGFKAYFLYAPLLFLLPASFRDDAEVSRFLRRYLLLAIPLGILAAVQFASPGASAVNTYARSNEEAYVVTFGSSDRVRVTSSFSFITGYTTYLVATSVLLLALLGAGRWRVRGNLRMLAALALTLAGMLMSGSRGPVFILAFLLPFFWWLAVMREGDAGGTFGRLVLAASVVVVIIMGFGGSALEAFLGRALGSTDIGNRLTSPIEAPLAVLPDSGLIGFGIGSSHQAAPSLAKTLVPYSWLKGLLIEVETGKVMVELGLPGFLLIYALRIALIVLALRTIATLRTRFHRSLAIASFLFMLSALFTSAVFDPTAGVFYWFFAGLLPLAIRLDRKVVSLPVPIAGDAAPSPLRTAPVPAAISPGGRWAHPTRASW